MVGAMIVPPVSLVPKRPRFKVPEEKASEAMSKVKPASTVPPSATVRVLLPLSNPTTRPLTLSQREPAPVTSALLSIASPALLAKPMMPLMLETRPPSVMTRLLLAPKDPTKSVVPPPVTDRSELLPVTKTELLSEAKPMAEVSNPLAVTVPPLLTTRLLLPPSLPT